MTTSRSTRSTGPEPVPVISHIAGSFIPVVIGIVRNTDGEVLITRRPRDVHLGGLLEFPGGKVEENESPPAALRRELKEELGIHVQRCTPLIQVPYSYPDRSVYLDVYDVVEYTGKVTGDKGAWNDWREIATLDPAQFPSANYGIIHALKLPKLIAVTIDAGLAPARFLQRFETVVADKAISVIQLRCHSLGHTQYMQLAEKCLALCTRHHTRLVLNRDASCVSELRAAGLHLTGKRLLSTDKRPLNDSYLVGASCHNRGELQQALKLSLDYVFIGPVMEKHLSQNDDVLGWEGFHALARECSIPAYAIGGLVVGDVAVSSKFGGQGIAAIRDFWSRVCK